MLRYVFSRLLVAALMVLLATLAIFLIANMVPGDPVLTQLGDIAANNPDMVADFRHKWGLDLPLWDRYWIFLSGVFHGDLGISIGSQRPVLDDIAQYAPATVELSTIAFLLALIVGLPLGVLAAMKRDTWVDHVARSISLVGVAAPTFWLAFIMLAVFYGALQWAPGPGQISASTFPRRPSLSVGSSINFQTVARGKNDGLFQLPKCVESNQRLTQLLRRNGQTLSQLDGSLLIR